MANASKRKGDNGELEAVEILKALAPDLVRPKAKRLLAAGRREDEGDLWVFPDTGIQVKTWANLTRACREAINGAVTQARTSDQPIALGMVPIPRASKDPAALRWLAVAHDWPCGNDRWEPVPTFGTTAQAVTHLRSGFGGRVPLHLRMARVSVRGQRNMLVAPIQAWVDSYRELREQQSSQDPLRPNMPQVEMVG